jgi:hypothetical protein
MTTFKKSGGRCSVSAVVSESSIRLQGRGGSPSGPKIQAQRAANPKSTIQNPKSKISRHYITPESRSAKEDRHSGSAAPVAAFATPWN